MFELLVILFVVLLIFGASRLPQLGSALGKTIRELRGLANETDGTAQADSSAKPNNRRR